VPDGPAETGGTDPKDRMAAGYSKAEEKNRKVRESLEPLAEGARPKAVTAGAIFAVIVALISWVSVGIAVFGVEIDGSQPNLAQPVAVALVMSLMAWGMWRARYWAVLGFQMLLVLLIIALIIGMVMAGSWVLFFGNLVLLVLLVTLFFYMVKAMARIQMPERPSAD
jgi:cation transport ATPase